MLVYNKGILFSKESLYCIIQFDKKNIRPK